VFISFIIVNWNTCSLLLDCLRSIQSTVSEYHYEIFVVDNGSEDGSAEKVKQSFGDKIHLIENMENRGFAQANNQALRMTSGNYVVLLNSDTVLRNDTVSKLVSFLEENPSAAMVGPCMKSGNGKAQNSYDNFPSLLTELFNKSLLRALIPRKFSGKTSKISEPFEVDSLIGACIAVRSEAIKDVGLLDEEYFFFLEETDWCLRMKKAGWKIFHLPEAEIVHLQGQSKKLNPSLAWIEYYRSLYKFFKKHRSYFSYVILRVFRFIKLIINLILNITGFFLTLGMKIRYREKSFIYAHLLWWHLKGCPDNIGLGLSK
jgi:hypothetical protein